MSAIPEDFINKTTQLSEAVTRPFPNSIKIYVQGSRPDIRVPMRQIRQADTPASFGAQQNPAITVYDTSGPYSDPDAAIDLLAGLPDVRFPDAGLGIVCDIAQIVVQPADHDDGVGGLLRPAAGGPRRAAGSHRCLEV